MQFETGKTCCANMAIWYKFRTLIFIERDHNVILLVCDENSSSITLLNTDLAILIVEQDMRSDKEITQQLNDMKRDTKQKLTQLRAGAWCIAMYVQFICMKQSLFFECCE